MSDPIYSFVKGEGWTLAPSVLTLECTLACGTRVRLEHRKPRIGEYFGRVPKWDGRTTMWVNKNNEPQLEHWAQCWRPYVLHTRSIQTKDTYLQGVYVTLVVLS